MLTHFYYYLSLLIVTSQFPLNFILSKDKLTAD